MGASTMRNVLIALIATSGVAWADPMVYPTPEAAVADLIKALDAKDRTAVLGIFGPEAEDILSTGDAEEDRKIWGGFLTDAKSKTLIEPEGEDRATLMVGRELWPFPAPLVRQAKGWSFDAEAAREEVLMRRIGQNELTIIEIMRRASAIQRLYRRTDHDGDGVMEFAASVLSSPGAKDGLYWQEAPGEDPSPFDEKLARASLTGYSVDGTDRDPEPYEGYYFRILQGQGEKAPGGAYSYLVNGNMVAGYAVVAYPAIYGDTGIMSFMVGENGVVLEADLGEETLKTAMAIELFDPGEEWVPVE